MRKELETEIIGESFAQREPLTRRLHGLIRSYPLGVGLIHEFIQNADDAGARTVHVFLDERGFPSVRLPHAGMAALQGPALVVTNDAEFSDDDWESIQQIGQSGKQFDSRKTGRFGLGFNSVYNLTDFPTILSGSRLGCFDPHCQVLELGHAWRLNARLWSEFPDLLAPFTDFGLPPRSTQSLGTVFRLPLRTESQSKRSEISQQQFCLADFKTLIGKLAAHAGETLLFLKSVQEVFVTHINASGKRQLMLSIQTVNGAEVSSARNGLRDALACGHAELLSTLAKRPNASITSEFTHTIKVCKESERPHAESYWVVHGLFSDSGNELVKCAQEMNASGEKAIPLAGAAARIDTGRPENRAGRLYCSLPLPIESPARGYDVHAFFDLQSDRQSIFQDAAASGGGELRVRWNRLLLTHACAEAVARVCLRLTITSIAERCSPYAHWTNVPEREASLVDCLSKHVYAKLVSKPCLSVGTAREMRAPPEVITLPSSASPEIRAAMLASGFPVADPAPPNFVVDGFRRASRPLNELTPSSLRKYLRVQSDPKRPLADAPQPCLSRPDWIRALLDFCLRDSIPLDLAGVPLALMADGTIRAFGLDQRNPMLLGNEIERRIFASKSCWLIDSLLEPLLAPHAKLISGVGTLNPALTLSRLKPLLPTPNAQGRVERDDNDSPAQSDEWLELVFRYLAERPSETIAAIDSLNVLPLVPDQFGFLWKPGLTSTPLLRSTDDSRLLKALTASRLPLVHGSPALIAAVRQLATAVPQQAVWELTPTDLIDSLVAVCSDANTTNHAFSVPDACAILDYLSKPSAIKDLRDPSKAASVSSLRSVCLFPSSSGELVQLDCGDRWLADDYDLPKMDIDLGLLDTGKKGNWLPLLDTLGVPRLTRARLLREVVIPRLDALSHSNHHELLLWLRRELSTAREEESQPDAASLVSALGQSILVACRDGIYRPPIKLYHPDAEEALKLIGVAVGVPDATTYGDRTDLWMELFALLGMAKGPRAADLVDGIDALLASTLPYEERSERICDLASYINHHWDMLANQPLPQDPMRPSAATAWNMSDALKSRTWIPPLRNAPRSYPATLLLSGTADFYRPSDILCTSCLRTAGSTRPVAAFGRLQRLQQFIGLQSSPPLESVLGHFENILTIAERGPDRIERTLKGLMEEVYRHLGDVLSAATASGQQSQELVSRIQQRFANRKCIVDLDHRVWIPRHCFQELTPYFLGKRASPRYDGHSDRGLEVLGRRKRPESADFLEFFAELAREHLEHPLPEEHRPLVRQAYQLCAQSMSGDASHESSYVLLDDGIFALAPDALVDDAGWLSERARKARLRFVDSKLTTPQLIESFGLQRLSAAVSELPGSFDEANGPDFKANCAALEQRLRSRQMLAGVKRLLVAEDQSPYAENLRELLYRFAILPVMALKTVLAWNDSGEIIDDSEGESEWVCDVDRYRTLINATSADLLCNQVAQAISMCLGLEGQELGKQVANLVEILRCEPARIKATLDRLRVSELPESELLSEPLSSENNFADVIVPEDDENPPEVALVEDSGQNDLPLPAKNRAQDPAAESGQAPHGNAFSDNKYEATSGGDVSARELHTNEQGLRTPRAQSTDAELNNRQSSASKVTESGDKDSRSQPQTASKEDLRGDPPNDMETQSPTPSREQRESGPGSTAGPPRERSRTQQGHARSYVSNEGSSRQDSVSERSHEHRSKVDRAAIELALEYERDRGRKPTKMPQTHEGYDIESFSNTGRLERIIEVKGCSGAWSTLGIAISRSQYRMAQAKTTEFWLYIIEWALEPNRAKVYAIQDPATRIDQYWFDSGWRDLAHESGKPGGSRQPVRGALVLVDGQHRATVRAIRRQGNFAHLQIVFGDGRTDTRVFPSPSVRILSSSEREY
jgi:hypothetical protein